MMFDESIKSIYSRSRKIVLKLEFALKVTVYLFSLLIHYIDKYYTLECGKTLP